MKLKDWRLEPPAAASHVGVCCGCGDSILITEEFRVFESGRRIHDHPDCKIWFVDRMLGLRR